MNLPCLDVLTYNRPNVQIESVFFFNMIRNKTKTFIKELKLKFSILIKNKIICKF